MKLQNAIWTRLVGILMQKSRPALPFGIITGLFRCPPGEMMTMEASPLYCCCGLSGFGIGFFFLTGGGGTFLGAGFGGVFLATGCPGCPAPALAVAVGAVEAVAGAVAAVAGAVAAVAGAVAGGWLKPWPCGALAGGLDAVG
jgi:hypothetical protein